MLFHVLLPFWNSAAPSSGANFRHAPDWRVAAHRRLALGRGWVVLLFTLGLLYDGRLLWAAVMDFSPLLQDVTADQVGGTVNYSVFDPALSTYVMGSDTTGSVFGLQDQDGVVTWNNGSYVFCRVYDPAQGQWIKTNLVSGGTFDLQTRHGVVTWSSGGAVQQFVYDAARRTWIGASVSSGATSNLRSTNGVVAWSSGSSVYGVVYDPVRGQWIGDYTAAAGSPSDLTTREGVVAWSAGNVIYFRTYDPSRGAWFGDAVASGSTSDLQTGEAVVAWSHLSDIYYSVYDPVRGGWRGTYTRSGQTFNLRIESGSVFWSASSVNYTLGYNVTNGTWTNSLTVPVPFAAFGLSTNSGNAPLSVWFFDLSLGASSWSWSFGDGQVTLRRSPYHVYTSFGRNLATLTVVGPGGNSSSNRVVLSDITPPTGTVLIDNGAEFTTNQVVTLSLSATDNSGLATTMRFSNDNSTWSAWEPFNTVKAWALTSGNGTKTVYAQFRDAALNEAAPVTDTIILDTTPPPVAAFETSNLSAGENTNTVMVHVVLSSRFNRTVSVDYLTLDGTAQEGSDYTGVSGRLVFQPGVTNLGFSVGILDDAQVELNETVILQLANPTNATVGAPATLTILDDDPPQVFFASQQYGVSENAGSAPISVQLSGPSGRTVTVRFLATNGTAAPYLDYVPVTSTLTFFPGQTVQSFSVPLLDDLLDEQSETVGLNLWAAVGALLGPVSNATLVIQDNDPPTVNFARAQWAAWESSGSAGIEVTLSKPFTQTIFVDYTTSNGTARAGADYVANTGTLIFAAGQTNKPLMVTLLNDGAAEGPETVYFLLTSASPATLGTQSQATLRIEDDDTPRLTAPRFNPQGHFQATVTGPVGQRLVMEMSTNFFAWAGLATLTNTVGTVEFVDPDAAQFLRRSYRARVLSP